MDYIDELKDELVLDSELEDDPSKFLESTLTNPGYERFINEYSKNPSRIFCFIEGNEDRFYYQTKLGDILEQPFILIKCEGKKYVHGMYDFCNNFPEKHDFSLAKIAFFVDRDFENNLHILGKDIYITEGYSFENFYTSSTSMEKICNCLFDFDSEVFSVHSVHKEEILEHFEQLQAKFHQVVLDFNVWAYYNTCIKLQPDKEKPKLFLNKFEINKLCRIDCEEVTKLYNDEYLNSKAKVSYQLDQNEKDRILQLWNNKFQLIFRGKQEVAFVHKYVSEILKVKFSNLATSKVQYPKSQSIEQFLSNFSGCADIPKCLKNYLNGINIKYKEVT